MMFTFFCNYNFNSHNTNWIPQSTSDLFHYENVEQKIEDEDNHDFVTEDNKTDEEEKEVEEDEDRKDDEEEEEEKKEKSNKKGSKKKGLTKVDKDVKKRGGFTKLCSLSPELQTLFGVSELARTEVVKKLWVYIKDNQLQDPKNKRNILCDESLHALFRVSSINMFQMNKVLSKHIWPLDKEDAPVDSTQKEKRRKQEAEGTDEPHRKEKRQKKGGSK
ncbi:upstream activation factor subunit spp27-like [Pistacia vera]|uniref:upstream activation factor subunit spp27-like n=1 Tax=Pistacia vera TaxID=55513 RepID=UPI0012633874|nr:upstream activation factor subunit spp27-like [Pistacia vera]